MGRGAQNTMEQAAVTRAPRLQRGQLLLAHRDDPRVADDRQVLLDFDSTVFPLLHAIGSENGHEHVTYETMNTYEQLVDDCGGVKPMLEMFDRVMPFSNMRRYPPFDGVRQFAEELAAANVRVHVVTDRKDHLLGDVARYLNFYGIPYASLTCELGIDKIAWCRDHHVGVLIDDHPQVLQRAASAGMAPVSLRYPYNGAALDEHELPHAEDWQELPGHVIDAIEDQIAATLAP